MIPLALFPYDKDKEMELSRFSQLRRAGQDGVEVMDEVDMVEGENI